MNPIRPFGQQNRSDEQRDSLLSLMISGVLIGAIAMTEPAARSDLQAKIIDRCLQLFDGYGLMAEYPLKRMYRDNWIERIYAVTNEIMKLVIARGLLKP